MAAPAATTMATAAVTVLAASVNTGRRYNLAFGVQVQNLFNNEDLIDAARSPGFVELWAIDPDLWRAVYDHQRVAAHHAANLVLLLTCRTSMRRGAAGWLRLVARAGTMLDECGWVSAGRGWSRRAEGVASSSLARRALGFWFGRAGSTGSAVAICAWLFRLGGARRSWRLLRSCRGSRRSAERPCAARTCAAGRRSAETRWACRSAARTLC